MEFCSYCHGGCCRALNVEVVGYDILKIHKTLGIDPFLFLTVVPVEGEKLKENFGKNPLFKFTDLNPEKYYKLILQSKSTQIFGDYSSKCIFLMEWDSKKLGAKTSEPVVARCGIYHCRPYTCRTFPAKLNEDLLPVMQDPHSGIKSLNEEYWQKPGYKLCPKPVEENDYINFSDQYFKDLYAQHCETEYFLKVSQKWNQNPDISDNFITFIEKEYSNRLLPPKKNKKPSA
ncbi:MAG TPA: YkgJ family cysteine cluster protein [Candidatus Gastranaerophilales bacterium]|nr:YkgJ family cysteine cluster protein [Candidatus Gastranaerophilales bacterium]